MASDALNARALRAVQRRVEKVGAAAKSTFSSLLFSGLDPRIPRFVDADARGSTFSGRDAERAAVATSRMLHRPPPRLRDPRRTHAERAHR